MAGCIAIGSRCRRALVHFLILHEPKGVQLHCMIEIRLQLKREKKEFFPYSVSDAVLVPISQGTEVTIVAECVLKHELNILGE